MLHVHGIFFIGIISSFLNSIKASDLDNFDCHEFLCYPKDNDPEKFPKDVLVYFDIESEGQGEAMNQVDDHHMMIIFEPVIFVAWRDPSLRLPSNTSNVEWEDLPDFLLKKIWYPKVSVEHKTPRKSDYHDPGKMCKS